MLGVSALFSRGLSPLCIPCCCACRTVSHPGWSPSRQAVLFRQPACHRHSLQHFSFRISPTRNPQSRRSGVCLTKCAWMFFFRSFISSQKKWRSPLPVALLWILAVIAGSGSQYFEKLGFPNWFIFAPCFMAGALAYKASSLRHLNLPAALWPIALALITLFYLRHDTIARSWWTRLALGLRLPQFREISTPVLLLARFPSRLHALLSHTSHMCLNIPFRRTT
jgi:hypothetical protein